MPTRRTEAGHIAPDATLVGPSTTLPVLVAEDNPVNQRVTAAMLRRLGLRVDVVDGGRQAVDAVGGAAYAAVLMD